MHHETQAPSHTHKHAHTYTIFFKKKVILIKIILTPIVSEILPNRRVLCLLWSLQAYVSLFFLIFMVSIHCTKGALNETFQYSWILCVEHIPLQTCLPCLLFPLLEPFAFFVSLNIPLSNFKIVIRSKRLVACLYISNLSTGLLNDSQRTWQCLYTAFRYEEQANPSQKTLEQWSIMLSRSYQGQHCSSPELNCCMCLDTLP